VFTIVLLALILPWSGIITRLISSVKEQMHKPFISQELFDQKWSEVRAVFNQAKSKGKEYAAMDYARGITRIALIQADLESKYRFDSRQAMILSGWKDNYGQLREMIKEGDRSTGGASIVAITQAIGQAREEMGMNGLISTVVTKARIIKFLKWFFLFAWPVSLIPILLLYFRRCQIREISFKELVILNPLKFLGCWIFGLIGLLMNFPGNDMAGLKRYLKLKNAYTRDKGWGHWLSEEEEAKLWQQARMPLERFDQRVQQTLAYSRVAAFVSSLFIWIFIIPFRSLAGQAQNDTTIVKLNTSTTGGKQNLTLAMLELGSKSGGLIMLSEKDTRAAYGPLWKFSKGTVLFPVGAICGKGEDGVRIEHISFWSILMLKFGKFNQIFMGSYNQPVVKNLSPYAFAKQVISYQFSRVRLGLRADYSFQKKDKWEKLITFGPAFEFLKKNFTIHLHTTITKPYTIRTEWQVAF